MAALPQILPAELSDYHVSRARCHQAAKRARRKLKRAEEGMDVDGDDKQPSSKEGIEGIPQRPEVLDHLVLGLNETIRALEHSIDDLRIRMALLAEGLDPSLPALLPTAPSSTPTPAPAASPEHVETGIAFVLVPHTSVSPLSLVDPLPTYCATYNTLLRQASDLGSKGKGLGRPIRIVPLGKREADIAAAAGLRRVTSVCVRASHPAAPVLERLLKAALQPPRHSVTLPWPTMTLSVHAGEGEEKSKKAGAKPAEGEKAAEKEKVEKTQGNTVPQPQIAYAPLHIKAVHTTAPLDNNARKAKRLVEVRAKRVEAKAQRGVKRRELERKVRAEVGGKALFGRKQRRTAREDGGKGRDECVE